MKLSITNISQIKSTKYIWVWETDLIQSCCWASKKVDDDWIYSYPQRAITRQLAKRVCVSFFFFLSEPISFKAHDTMRLLLFRADVQWMMLTSWRSLAMSCCLESISWFNKRKVIIFCLLYDVFFLFLFWSFSIHFLFLFPCCILL